MNERASAVVESGHVSLRIAKSWPGGEWRLDRDVGLRFTRTMNVSPRKIIVRVLVAGTLIGVGVFIGCRLSQEQVREAISISRYKAGLRLLMTQVADEHRQLLWRDCRELQGQPESSTGHYEADAR